MDDKYLLALMYDFYNKHTLKGQNDDITYYIKQIDNYKAKKILVVGAGTGRVAIPLSNYSEVTALDFDKERLMVLKSKCENIKTICVNFLEFDSKEHYDLIIIPYSTFQFDCDKTVLKKMLKKLKQLLSDKTVAIFDLSESFINKIEKENELLFTEYYDEIGDEVSVYYTSKRYSDYINFIVKYKLKYLNKELIENEKYYYYDYDLILKLLAETNLELIRLDKGYGKDGFKHKNLYHCRSCYERK